MVNVMTDFIHELYLTYLSQKNPTSKSAAYHQAMSRFSELESKLAPLLPEDSRALLADFYEAWDLMEEALSEETFAEGFQMGARLMLELFKEEPVLERPHS